MKKFLCGFLAFFILFSTVGARYTYIYGAHTTQGFELEFYSISSPIMTGSPTEVTDDVLKGELLSKLGYEGDLVTPMQITTQVRLSNGSRQSDNKYTRYHVSIGNADDPVVININGYRSPEVTLSTDDIKNYLACPDSITFENEEYSYDVVLRAEPRRDIRTINNSIDGTIVMQEYVYMLDITDVWSDADIGNYGDSFDNVQDAELEGVDRGWAYETWDGIVGAVSDAFDFVSNFMENPIGTTATLLLEALRVILGDWVQVFADMVQTISIGTADDLAIVYDKEHIRVNQELNDYAKVDDYVAGGGQDWQTIKDISGEDYEFDEETPIPVIPVDMYNMAIGNIDFLDVNFLVANNSSSAWMAIRNFFTAIIHILMYIAAAFLLGMLIYHGIMIVVSSYRSPTEVRIHREGVFRFIQSLGMLFGTILVMALFIYVSDFLLSDNMQAGSDELPIRVNVEGAYSFSTNITGYARYMSQIKNVDLYIQKAGYTATFIIMSWLNLAAVVLLIGRMLAMMALAIWGILIAVGNVASVNFGGIQRFSYRTWIILYASFAAVQLFLAIISNIVLETLN